MGKFCWFSSNSNSILAKGKLEYRCGLSINRSMDSLGPIENPSISKDPVINDTEEDKKIHGGGKNSSYYSTLDHLIAGKDLRNLISDKTFLIRDSNRNTYFIYFDIENQIFEIANDHSFLSELEGFFTSHSNSSSNSSWTNYINSCIDSYLRSQICIGSFIRGESENSNESSITSENSNESSITSENSNESSISNSVCDESGSNSQDENFNTKTSASDNDLSIKEESNDLNGTQKYRHLWVPCENCYGLNYKRFLKSKMSICEYCGFHLKMNSLDRIELSIDPGTWNPMDEDMISLDPIEFDSEEDEFDSEKVELDFEKVEFDSEEIELDSEEIELDSEEESDQDHQESDQDREDEESDQDDEESYKDRIDSYQRKTGLTEAVQTGTGQLNGIPIAIAVMDFQFMGGSMGSVVGEKITRLIEYATNHFLPLIIVCASGGARMQEGSLSLMQMAKISSALYDYQSNKKLFYVSILTSPTTGGVTASFGMLGDIIIAEPDAYIAFAGKRVIEQTLNITVPEGSQEAEYLFDKGLFDPIVPRKLLKGVLSELFQLHDFLPLTPNQVEP
uniref:Acetyl-coenzyme A carboxylase carboxyl transferase subunit beta, chloroplastic n=1 Tax=Phaleria macrocarpa TaxID=223762 RepID=A0A7G9XJ82_9ROSI|nr:acetyl-CoA carboxylase carboxyltransferase beta subunit [Phaleria macrocarpa]QNO35440.1 acetyl-CoA carboxylase carboxyltransferase beta subunit [Phaleria macrocarpa]